MIDFRELIKAGSHFGHVTARWHPNMGQYIWGMKNKVHLIDVSKTAFQLEKAAKVLEEIAAQDKQVLWVGTKRAAQKAVTDVGTKLNMPYVSHRWIGGTLSNFDQVKLSVTKFKHYEDILARSEQFPYYTKKELNVFNKMVNRLKKSVGGLQSLRWPVGALVVVDVTKEFSAIREATAMGVPVIAIVDTNGNPALVDYAIPANDDAPRSIEVILEYLSAAVARGKDAAKQAKAAQEAALAAERAAKKDEAAKAVSAKKGAAEKSAADKPAAKPAESKPAEVAMAPKATEDDDADEQVVKKPAAKKNRAVVEDDEAE